MDEQRQRDERLDLEHQRRAHDFKNLLVGIMGNLELTLMKLGPTDVSRPRIEQAYQAASRAAELAGQMLASFDRGRVSGAGPAPPGAAAGEDR